MRIDLYKHDKSISTPFVFTNDDIAQGSAIDNRDGALIAENLSTDTFSFTLKGRDTGFSPLFDVDGEWICDVDGDPIFVRDSSYGDVDFTQYQKYRDYVKLYDGAVLIGKYYVEKVTAAGDTSGEIDFTCVSVVGILENMSTYGGIYTESGGGGEVATAGTLIAGLMGSYAYSIDSNVASTPIHGWIPAGTRRAALKHILFAHGIYMLYDRNGDPYFTFSLPVTAEVPPVTFIGGNIEEIADAATRVELTEHGFFKSSNVTAEVIFENTGGITADHSEIICNQPYHTLVGAGITIHESGANYAIISGTGTITGVPFVHIQRVLTADTGANVSNSVATFPEAYLINALNSAACIQRLAAYYGQTSEVVVDVQGADIAPGDMLKVVNPIDYGKTLTGYIKSIKRTFSMITKSSVKLTRGWRPTGGGSAYDDYLIITASALVNGHWIVPPDYAGKPALMTLFSGAQGGTGGYDGAAGERSEWLDPDASPGPRKAARGGDGGLGGDGAQGGNGGRYLQVSIANLASDYEASMGAGGIGGARNGGEGADGGDTTLGSYSTENGTELDGMIYVNLVDGTTYGEAGANGTPGAAGGKAGDFRSGLIGQQDPGEDGGDYDDTWVGGKGAVTIDYDSTYSSRRGSGGGGGGAAYGASGEDGGQDSSASTIQHPGAGADAITPTKAAFAHGGAGGHGGGGGGGGGYSFTNSGGFYSWTFDDPAAGGLGSDGGDGADGWILAYHNRRASLPSGYTQLDYIEASESQYIKTNITASGDVMFAITGEAFESAANQIWASRSASPSDQWYGYMAAGSWRGSSVTGKAQIVTKFTTTTIDFDVNGEADSISKTPTTKGKCAFLATNDGDYPASGRLYRAGIFHGGAWVFMGIPAKYNGVAGLYDLVGGSFYTSASADPFVAGPEV